MAHYTTLAEKDLKIILDNFNTNNLLSFKVLDGGIENTNYLLNTENGKFVLTICEQKSAIKTKELADLLVHLENHQFYTSKIFRNKKNESVTLWKGKPVIIKKFIEGKIKEDLSPELLILLGNELGKLHKIIAPDYVPNELNYGIENFNLVEKYAPNSSFNIWLKEIVDYLSPYLMLDL
ncbi:phosphotransferase, partial [Aureispira]|nr:phosphotransferase [Aureispira sp.]